MIKIEITEDGQSKSDILSRIEQAKVIFQIKKTNL